MSPTLSRSAKREQDLLAKRSEPGNLVIILIDMFTAIVIGSFTIMTVIVIVIVLILLPAGGGFPDR